LDSLEVTYTLLSRGAGKGEIKKPPANSGLNFSLLPFQTPTRLAVGLGPGSALSLIGIRPKCWVPRIHSLNESRLLFDLTLLPSYKIVKRIYYRLKLDLEEKS